MASVGGASGPLYGTAFIEAGFALAGRPTAGPADLAAALEAGQAGLVRRGRCVVGDKTILDALDPAVRALREGADAGDPLGACVAAAAVAAAGGMRATIPLVARRGLALRLGERSRGHRDPGATSCFLLLAAMARAVGGASRGMTGAPRGRAGGTPRATTIAALEARIRALEAERRRIFEDAQREADAVYAQYQLSQLLAAGGSVDEIASAVLAEVARASGAAGAGLWLASPGDRAVQLVATFPGDPGDPVGPGWAVVPRRFADAVAAASWADAGGWSGVELPEGRSLGGGAPPERRDRGRRLPRRSG